MHMNRLQLEVYNLHLRDLFASPLGAIHNRSIHKVEDQEFYAKLQWSLEPGSSSTWRFMMILHPWTWIGLTCHNANRRLRKWTSTKDLQGLMGFVDEESKTNKVKQALEARKLTQHSME